MSYRLKFVPAAMREWQKLAPPIQSQFKKKLAERLLEPHIPASRLRGLDNAYKLKLRASGYRLVYQVDDAEMAVYAIPPEQLTLQRECSSFGKIFDHGAEYQHVQG